MRIVLYNRYDRRWISNLLLKNLSLLLLQLTAIRYIIDSHDFLLAVCPLDGPHPFDL